MLHSFPEVQDEVVSTLEFYAGLAQMLEDQGDEDLKVPDPNLKIVIRREPLGVCALITPWNVSPDCQWEPQKQQQQVSLCVCNALYDIKKQPLANSLKTS